MDAQLDLSFAKPATDDPQIAVLVEYLHGKGWMTAKAISAGMGWDDRVVRALASASDEIISYPGSPGYKLLSDTTREEYERYRLARRSQARDMIAKVIRTDRVFFRRQAVSA
jgi:hypothetical protein